MTPVLQVEGLTVEFQLRAGPGRRLTLRAVDGVDLVVRPGETLGVVGESGCGKSTLARAIAGLVRPCAGRILVEGRDLAALDRRGLRELRPTVQMVFQDPYSTFNPRRTIGSSIAEPLRNFRVFGRRTADYRRRVDELLRIVHLDPSLRDRFPHQLSGGQRQRAAVARALALEPRLLILDEPLSALDVSMQAGLVNLLVEIQQRLQVAYLFIAHDLAVVRTISSRVAVMYLGAVVETGSTEEVFARPAHPYTRALLSAVPVDDPADRGRRERIILRGEVPRPTERVVGCRFRSRCYRAEEVCATVSPPLAPVDGSDHDAACLFAAADELVARTG